MTTISLYTGDVPALNQPQPTFDVNTQAFIDYIATLAPEINTFAALMNAISTTDISVTSNTVGAGSKTFTVSAGKSFFIGMSLTIARTSAPTNRMFAVVTSYSGTTLQVTSQAFEGSGTFTDWSISASFNGVISTDQLADLGTTNAKLAQQYINDLTEVTFDHGNDFVAIGDGSDSGNKKKSLISSGKIQPISASVSSNALTITLNPTALDFRAATLTSGSVNTRAINSAISTVISSGSTGGTVNGVQSRIVVLAIDNAGTVVLGWTNIAGGRQLDETNLITTIAEGGAGGADSANVIYTTVAVTTPAPYRVVGYVESTQATAGTWATLPSVLQGYGGQAFAAFSSIGYGQTWQSFVGSRNINTTYYNTKGKPISVSIMIKSASGSADTTLVVNGVSVYGGVAVVNQSYSSLTAIVPPNCSYQMTSTGGSPIIAHWSELS